MNALPAALPALVAALLAPAAASCGAGGPPPAARSVVQDTLRGVSVPAPAGERVCDERFVGIRMEVRAPDGTPVSDAEVEVRRERDGAVVRTARGAVDARGGYIVLDDDTPGPIVPAAAFIVAARRGTEGAQARVVVGADGNGCHVRLLQGPTVLQLR